MSISQEIREAVRAARAASETQPGNPFKQVLDEVARGLTDDSVQADFTSSPGGRWTLSLAPAHRPARSVPMLSVVISSIGADLMVEPKRSAATPAELAEMLKEFVTKSEFIESLQTIGELSKQPVEGFLRMAPRTVSREDLMLEVPPEKQREIADAVDKDISLHLRIADFRGAGTFKAGTPYKVLESAGFSVMLTQEVEKNADGTLLIVGHVGLSSAS